MNREREFKNTQERVNSIYQRVKALVNDDVLSSNCATELEDVQNELKREGEITLTPSLFGLIEFPAGTRLPEDQNVVRVASSTSDAKDDIDIFVPNADILEGRTLNLIQGDYVQAPSVNALRQSDALLFNLENQLTEDQIRDFELCVSLAKTRSTGETPPIRLIYSADLEADATLMEANQRLLAEKLGMDVDVHSYVISEDNRQLVSDIQASTTAARERDVFNALAGLKPEIEAADGKVASYIDRLGKERDRRAAYELALTQKTNWEQHRHDANRTFKVDMHRIKRDILRKIRYEIRKKFKYSGRIMSTMMRELDKHEFNTDEQREAALEAINNLLKREKEDAYYIAIEKIDAKVLTEIRRIIHDVVSEIVAAAFGVNPDDIVVTVDEDRKSEMPESTTIFQCHIQVRPVRARQLYTLTVSISIGIGIGMGIGSLFGPVGTVVGGVIGGILGGIGGLIVNAEDTAQRVRQKCESAIRTAVIECGSTTLEAFDEVANEICRAVAEDFENVMELTTEAVNAELARHTDDIPGYSVEQLNAAIKSAEEQRETLKTLSADIIQP